MTRQGRGRGRGGRGNALEGVNVDAEDKMVSDQQVEYHEKMSKDEKPEVISPVLVILNQPIPGAQRPHHGGRDGAAVVEVPLPPLVASRRPPALRTIINVDLISFGGSETSVDTGPLDVPPAAEQVEEVESLNTALLHESLPDSPGSPTYTTARALLSTTSTTSVTTPSLTGSWPRTSGSWPPSCGGRGSPTRPPPCSPSTTRTRRRRWCST